ncbi:hypothetical protein FPSE_06465 [Fusarium pseudograminearum CS3096]|uniref:Uncharacterized protein n=1 Tax=Fusarium pseudograminearum (strain CS3096) TaxID=1028729 RepID=K3VJG2_FUSPC|nr:hypothetical protein FPSE_06465 [Fusarium pseudograminearum CS3096]EKJ73393.1 hypothetical protein FPSE_06465 [Fusarium pseudograminearum CS3096]
MCKEDYAVYAPCAHWVYGGKTKCLPAESLVGGVMGRLGKGCNPRTGLQIVIDWCPECKDGFAKVIQGLKQVVPAGYHNLWDYRLLSRYWAIKSQSRCSKAVDADPIGYQAFASDQEIKYIPFDQFNAAGEREDGFWELQALENEVRRLQPDFAWIKGDPQGARLKLSDQLSLCGSAIEVTELKAWNHGKVEQKCKGQKTKERIGT